MTKTEEEIDKLMIELNRWADEKTREIQEMKLQVDLIINKFNKSDGINCVCLPENKTGSVKINCCNICGKPDEKWWGKPDAIKLVCPSCDNVTGEKTILKGRYNCPICKKDWQTIS